VNVITYVFQDPEFNIQKIMKETGFSQPTITEATWLLEFVGAIKKVKSRVGRKEGPLYAMGQWVEGAGGYRAVPLLSRKSCETRLRELFWIWKKEWRKRRRKIPDKKQIPSSPPFPNPMRVELKGGQIIEIEFVKPKTEPNE
jgi:hypothetical protein